MKRALAILLAILTVCSLTACAKDTQPGAPTAVVSPDEPAPDDDWAYIKGNGKLIIGITEYEPMNYYDADGKLTGFDTEFAEKVCANLGVTPEFTIINWDTKEIELASKKIDCIWNGLTVTEERKANIAFTQSYLMNEQVVIIRAADSDKYKDAGSLSGKTVVAEAESAGETAIMAGLSDSDYVAVAAQSSALLEVKSGTAEAAVIDLTMANAMTGSGSEYSDLMIVKSIKMQPEEYAIGFRIGSNAVEKLNEAISKLMKDGFMTSIANKYDLADLLIK